MVFGPYGTTVATALLACVVPSTIAVKANEQASDKIYGHIRKGLAYWLTTDAL